MNEGEALVNEPIEKALDNRFRLDGLKVDLRMTNQDQVQAALAALGALAEADPAMTDEQIAERAAGIVATARFEYRFAGGPWRPLHVDLSGYGVDVNDKQARIVPPAPPKEGEK